MMKRLRILLADDHTMVSAGFKKLLEPDYEVVGSVEDGHALLKAAAELKPDLVIVDVGMPLLNGLDAGRRLKTMMPAVKLVYLTMNSDSDLAKEALEIGASAYLLKNSLPSELLRAVHDVVRGMSYITPQITQALDEGFIRDPREVSRPKYLTSRQREILQLLAEGRSMKEIAYILRITHRTVRFHKAQIMEELGIHSNMQLLQYAIKHGMVFSH
jgi:DNA-binding NarL/FixJ family response regulator